MNLSHLKYVLEVGKTNSITRAAHNLYMGQPNLSKAIKELESEIGITIFKRAFSRPAREGNFWSMQIRFSPRSMSWRPCINDPTHRNL